MGAVTRVRVTLCAVLAAVVVAGVVTLPKGGRAAGNCNADPSISADESTLLSLINQYRSAHGRPTLSISTSLSRSAQWKAEHLGTERYFAHDDRGIGRTWAQRIGDCGYPTSGYIAENLAAGIQSAQAAFDAWKASPGHDANMLKPDFHAIGIGYAYVPESPYGWYWVTDFGWQAETVSSKPTRTPAPTPTVQAPPVVPIRFTPPPSRPPRRVTIHQAFVPGAAKDHGH